MPQVAFSHSAQRGTLVARVSQPGSGSVPASGMLAPGDAPAGWGRGSGTDYHVRRGRSMPEGMELALPAR